MNGCPLLFCAIAPQGKEGLAGWAREQAQGGYWNCAFLGKGSSGKGVMILRFAMIKAREYWMASLAINDCAD